MDKLAEIINQVIKEKKIKVNSKKDLDLIFEKCWAGYVRKGTKTMFGKKYPNCVKK